MANSVKIIESSSLDRTKEVMKWIEFGVSVSKTILYPLKKAHKFAEVQTNMDTVTSFSPGYSKDIQNLAKDITGKVDTYLPKKELIDSIVNTLSYIGYGFTINKIVNKLLADEENDLSMMCIHIKRHQLEIAKKVTFGAVILLAMGYFLSKTLSSSVKKLYEYLKDAIKILTALYYVLFAIYLIYVLIKLRVKGKKWTINDSEMLVSCLGMFLEVLEVPFIEFALIKPVKPYWIGVGVTSVANIAKTVLIPFTTAEPVTIEGGFFSGAAVSSNPKKLFLYFCGSGEATKNQLKRFMKDVDAKHQLYINGVGSQRTIYRDLYDSDLKVAQEQIGNNTVKYRFKNDKRDITCIEKFYTGGDRGYKNDDAEKASGYIFSALKEALKNNEIDELVLSGHGRGAAVGLMYLLHRLNTGNELTERLKSLKIAVIPLDPVAGPMGNDYGKMNADWYSGQLYDGLFEKFGSMVAITEVWANADTTSAFSSFNPAKRFLNNPLEKVMLARLLLGYEHNAMVSANEEYTENYEAGKAPYYQVVALINNIAVGLIADEVNFNSKINGLQADFDLLNKRVRELGTVNYHRYMRTKYEDHKAQIKDFFDFVSSYKYHTA